MVGADVVADFIAASGHLSSIAALSDLTGEAARALGFARFAIVHHVPFGAPTPGAVCLNNYPVDFLVRFRDAGRAADPILRAAERTACGFRWQAVAARVRLSPCEEAHRTEAARHGLLEGYTVPNHVPGEAPGSCSFAVAPGKPLEPRMVPAAEALGRFAFEAGRRLTRALGAQPLTPLPLSPRQRDCVVLAAAGKSDTVIAQLLGLKPRTVNEHMEAAKRRYAVATRAQLIVLALLRNEIGFAEVMGRSR